MGSLSAKNASKKFSRLGTFNVIYKKTHVSYREKLSVAQVADSICLDFRDVFLPLHSDLFL